MDQEAGMYGAIGVNDMEHVAWRLRHHATTGVLEITSATKLMDTYESTAAVVLHIVNASAWAVAGAHVLFNLAVCLNAKRNGTVRFEIVAGPTPAARQRFLDMLRDSKVEVVDGLPDQDGVLRRDIESMRATGAVSWQLAAVVACLDYIPA